MSNWQRIISFSVALGLAGALWACAPTPREQGVSAVVAPTAGGIQATSVIILPTPFTPAPQITDEATSSTPNATDSASPTAAVTPSPVPATADEALPAGCNVPAPQNGFTVSLGYAESICRLVSRNPANSHLAFVQLTAEGNREQLWLLTLESGDTTLITDSAWADDRYRALAVADWSASGQLLIVHAVTNGLAPATIYNLERDTFLPLGTLSQVYWSSDKLAVLGWAVGDDCLFSRLVGYDFELDQPLQSLSPGNEVVGQLSFAPDSRAYAYTRIRLTGQCPNCVYQPAQTILASPGGDEHEILLSDSEFDYLLFGFQGENPVVAQRPYTVRTCADPQTEAQSQLPATFLLFDIETGETTPINAP